MLVHAILVLLLVNSSLSGPLSRSQIAHPSANSDGYRLPVNIKPSHYNVLLEPNFNTNKFTGTVEIIINVQATTRNIVLHQAEIEIDKSKIKVSRNTQPPADIPVIGTSYSNDDKEFYTITFGNDLVAGEYVLTIADFVGTLNNQNRGFYLAKYTDTNGVQKSFATTQFEPTNARRAFPCFDEPALKAIFKIDLIVPKGYSAVSNMPELKSTPIEQQRTKLEFKDTEKMSTYLIAFIVSDLQLSQQHDRQRILARPKPISDHWEQYALITGEKVLKAMEEFVNVDYSFPKIDQAGIPDEYFSAGAMENWGLVTYRETYLLYSEKLTQLSRKQQITSIIAHEYGHQWFGNLVSPAWWEFIWLNEGFATYFEYYAASKAEPDWDIMDQFVVKNLQYAFGPDSLDNTRPMNQDAGPPQDISALFDRIAYEKSGCVIRMMEMFLTTPVFRKGLNSYLTDRGFKEATPGDLYRNLQSAVSTTQPSPLPTDLSVQQIMASWDSVSGYPVVTVERKYGAATNNVKLTQTRFKLNNKEGESGRWIIPINFATSKSTANDFAKTTADHWLRTPDASITINNLADTEWLLLNKQQTGYYRVNYDKQNWELLTQALRNNHTNIHRLNRAQLIDDAFNLARSGRINYNTPLELMKYLSKEEDYFPLYSFFTAISFVNNMLLNTPAQTGFQNEVVGLLENIYKRLGVDEKNTDKHVDKMNRANVLKWMCDLGHQECRKTAAERFQVWKGNNQNGIALNLQEPLLCGAMRTTNQQDWNHLFEKYTQENSDAQLRSRFITALGCSENKAIVEGYLAKLTTPNSNLPASEIFASVYNAGSFGIQTVLDYIEQHFDNLRQGMSDSTLELVIRNVGTKLTTDGQYNKLKAISDAHPQQQNLFTRGLAEAQTNVKFSKDKLSQFSNYFGGDDNSDPDGSAHIYCSAVVVTLSYVISVLVK